MTEAPDGPYATFRAQRADGGARHQWGILDHHYVPAEPIRDWQRKHRVTWYGTREEAEELCAMLNKDRKILGKPIKTEFEVTSATQMIWRMNQAKKRASAGQKSVPPATRRSSGSNKIVMQKCPQCERMFTGDHSC